MNSFLSRIIHTLIWLPVAFYTCLYDPFIHDFHDYHLLCAYSVLGTVLNILHKFLHLILAIASRGRDYYSSWLMRLRNLLHFFQLVRDGTRIWTQSSYSIAHVLKYMLCSFSYHAVWFRWCCHLFAFMSISLPRWQPSTKSCWRDAWITGQVKSSSTGSIHAPGARRVRVGKVDY